MVLQPDEKNRSYPSGQYTNEKVAKYKWNFCKVVLSLAGHSIAEI